MKGAINSVRLECLLYTEKVASSNLASPTMIDLIRKALIDELKQEFPQLKFVVMDIPTFPNIKDRHHVAHVVGIVDNTGRKTPLKLQFEGAILTTSIPPLGLTEFTATNIAICDLADPKIDFVDWTKTQIENWLNA